MVVKAIGGYMKRILLVGLGYEQIGEESLDNEILWKYVGSTLNSRMQKGEEVLWRNKGFGVTWAKSYAWT